jgi:radical SAM protein with 4Fe4S-binding SPASM domain
MKSLVSPGQDRDERVARNSWRPRQCVWELTLACDRRCAYCGSRAGSAMPRELDTDRCLEVIAELSSLGCEIVSLSGGEPTLRRDWDRLAAECVRRGMMVNMVTHGVFPRHEHRREVVDRALQAGLCNLGVSIDGPENVHDSLRGEGTFVQAIRTVQHCEKAGLPAVIMTTVSRANLAHLGQTMQIAIDAGASVWRLQLAKPMGRWSADAIGVLDPRQIVGLVDTLLACKRRGGIAVAVGDSIGYFGPEGDCLRAGGWRRADEVWMGCQAGLQAVGIEADGAVKGCLSLQAGRGEHDPFVEGNLLDQSLEAIWTRPGAFGFNRDFSPQQLQGACRKCSKRSLCRGGAACVASAVHGTPGEDPYCYHRGTVLQPASAGRELARSVAVGTALALGAAGCGGTVDASQVNVPGDASISDGSVNASDSASLPDAREAGLDAVAEAQADAVAEVQADAVQEYDCSKVSCYLQTDYAAPSPPKEVLIACCCQTACCMCDYGPPPPAVCCEDP